MADLGGVNEDPIIEVIVLQPGDCTRLPFVRQLTMYRLPIIERMKFPSSKLGFDDSRRLFFDLVFTKAPIAAVRTPA